MRVCRNASDNKPFMAAQLRRLLTSTTTPSFSGTKSISVHPLRALTVGGAAVFSSIFGWMLR